MERKTLFFLSMATNDTRYGISMESQKVFKTYLHTFIQALKGYRKARGQRHSAVIRNSNKHFNLFIDSMPANT